MKAKKSKIVSIAVSSVILVIVLVLNIAVGIFSDTLDKFIVGYNDGGSDSETRTEGLALQQQIQEEGTVLVKNQDENGEAILPLSHSEAPKLNVFGWAATDWVISGSGSGQVKRDGSTDLLAALKEYGVEYNEELINMYESFRPNREFSINGSHAGTATAGNPNDSGSLHSFNYEFSRLYEPSIDDGSFYTDTMLKNAEAFSDTAIVVIGRVSGESNDSPAVQYKQTSGKNKSTGMLSSDKIDDTRTYLEISTEEEALLGYVGKNYENVIVLINSTNVMELGFMDTIDGLDACLIVGTTGSAGAKAIPEILYGDITPSGKTADTYAYDLTTSSTYADAGKGNDTTHFYTNGSGLYPTTVKHTNGSSSVPYRGVAYEDYREGIYVGYKWYETADTERFWDSEYAKQKWGLTEGYEDVVQYPFGYGLSYTDFQWEITYLSHLNNETLHGDDTIRISVRVTNVGDYPGQDVVELYYTAPYTKSGIEKSSVNLVAFGKTQRILKKGEHEDINLEFKVSDMASYDYGEKVISGGGYVLEDGEYQLTLRTDAHTLAGNKVAGGNDTITYRIDGDTQVLEEATNRFTGTDTTDGVAIDGNSDGSADITYLSRADFAATFPAEWDPAEDRAMTDAIKERNLYTSAMASAWDKAWQAENPEITDVTFGDTTKKTTIGGMTSNENGQEYYQLSDDGYVLGMKYDDPMWEDLLDSIPKSEMQELVLHGYTKTKAVKSINKPETLDFDGPNQINSFIDGKSKTGFNSIVLAQTWNIELAYSMGLTFGAECAEASISGWYGPGVNIHRSPFGGRNYEYYSEDPLISGLMCAKSVQAAKNRGVFSYLKHICLYESESGRDGMYTWLTEQALREIYLRPFEIAVKEGGATGIMTSYGRIGAVWTGGSEALLTEVCRDEWGFRGTFLTDYADHHEFMNGDQMLRAGGNLWMDGWNNDGKFRFDTSSVAYDYALRTSTKNILYMWMNALATNTNYNMSPDADKIVIPVSPELKFRWYIPVLAVFDVLAIGGCGVWLFFTLRKKKGATGEVADDATEPETVESAATPPGEQPPEETKNNE